VSAQSLLASKRVRWRSPWRPSTQSTMCVRVLIEELINAASIAY
jgi:hypothetical protein